MNNRWHEIWNKRIGNVRCLNNDEFTLYKELKRLDGFDVNVNDEDNYYKTFYQAMQNLYRKHLADVSSVFEVGCGSGANLLLLKNNGLEIAGLDYSENLVSVANNVLNLDNCIICDEAINIPVMPGYDAVLSDSVFAYFTNYEYAMTVLEKMYKKSNNRIIICEILDKDKEKECIAYRKSMLENYDEIYKGLEKLFYPRCFFEQFALDHNCKIEFSDVYNEYYWNSDYMYNCIISK